MNKVSALLGVFQRVFLAAAADLRQAGLMTIRSDDMETAGEMVQDLCGFLQAC